MNDFVNPKHRDVTLPPGYKDLIDVLEAKKKKSASSGPSLPLKTERIPARGLEHVEAYLQRFLLPRSKWTFLTILPQPDSVALMLLHGRNGPYAVFVFPNPSTTREKAVREIFMKSGVVPMLDELAKGAAQRVIRYGLPKMLPEALKIVTDVLKQACEVSDKDGLTFLSRE